MKTIPSFPGDEALEVPLWIVSGRSHPHCSGRVAWLVLCRPASSKSEPIFSAAISFGCRPGNGGQGLTDNSPKTGLGGFGRLNNTESASSQIDSESSSQLPHVALPLPGSVAATLAPEPTGLCHLCLV